MVLQQLLRMRSEREEALRRKFFEITGLEEEDEEVSVVVRLTEKPELLEVALRCKRCGYETLVATLLPEDPSTWTQRIATSAGSAIARFSMHPCKSEARN